MKYSQRHVDKVLRLIRERGVVVKERKKNALDVSWANIRTRPHCITLGVSDFKYLVLAVVAHEFGHCLSFDNGTSLTKFVAMSYKLGVVFSKRDGRAIVAEERRAWRLGFKFLRDNGITVDEKMLHARRVLVRHHVKLVAKRLV